MKLEEFVIWQGAVQLRTSGEVVPLYNSPAGSPLSVALNNFRNSLWSLSFLALVPEKACHKGYSEGQAEV